MSLHRKTTRSMLLGGAALAGALILATGAAAQEARQYEFNLPAQSLSSALQAYGATADQQLMFADADVEGRTAPALKGSYTAEGALRQLLAGTDLQVRRTDFGVLQILRAADPQGGSADGGADANAVDALIVTAQKREENIQDVPIAISAFSQKSLDEQKIEGGYDLLRAIPNVTFSKSNFTSYNFSIRGIGTKATSATSDPGVAVSFNNTGLIQNRLFEQEYFDVERVEVLRGPQGTLYGRNATGGVINVISAKPNLYERQATAKAEVGNYDSRRLSGMVNVPLIEDVLAVRVAGALTSRSGYDFNTTTGNAVNGRELWSLRTTVGFEPTERLRGNLIWEHFEEDDNRSRTGKQLCHRDDGPTQIGSTNLLTSLIGTTDPYYTRANFSAGCQPGSLYDEAAYGTPNGLSYAFVLGAITAESFPGGRQLIQHKDPYGGRLQSRDMREIESIRDPIYRASADIYELNLEFDVTPSLTFISQTAYNTDQTYSFQDYTRFASDPMFLDTSLLPDNQAFYRYLAPGGVFCDPQIGCSDTIAGFDISSAEGEQFSQEFRLQSDFEGPVNFSVGANYTRFDTQVDYYVMFNLLTMMAHTMPFNNAGSAGVAFGGDPENGLCNGTPWDQERILIPTDNSQCVYIDPNPVESINGEGHNYFRSKNPYSLNSWAAFGEAYWNVTEDLKVTAGLRYTDDRKTFIPVPSQVLLAPSTAAGGTVSKGYPEKPPIEVGWGEFTGRLGVDWKTYTPFTDETMLYGFYSRGYKGGGVNPPSPGFATLSEILEHISSSPQAPLPVLQLMAVEYGPTFEPEFVNAFELGAKNVLLDGALTLNLTGFYYDYKDYQVSQIRDRTAVNENFDATVKGAEVEAVFAPTRTLRINANLGYLDTEIADGESSIDTMDRTAGNPNYVLTKPWVQLPSNCVIPVHVVENFFIDPQGFYRLCGGLGGVLPGFFSGAIRDPILNKDYDPRDYPEINGGAGIRKDLGGNELPNAPHWTANLGLQYSVDFLDDWRATFRTDAYWQSQSWARVYNSDPYDKLHGWYNLNLSFWVERPDDGLKIEVYVKNALDSTPITDAFLNSDDTGLTTNVFTLDPRLVGLSVRKEF